MACSDFESSVIPSSQSPKVDLTWFLWRTVPLQKVSFMELGRVLRQKQSRSITASLRAPCSEFNHQDLILGKEFIVNLIQ